MAVLQAGEQPLWFQVTDEGCLLKETIEETLYSAALIPWPLAPHIRFSLAKDGELVMAVNRNGFIRFSPWDGGAGVGLYHYPGGAWHEYTVGALALIKDKPVALLYRDDKFYDADVPPPSPRLWTLDLYSNVPRAIALPALDAFVAEDGWDIDTLRQGDDGLWYYRAVKKNTAGAEILMLRSSDLALAGERITLGSFQNAALPGTLSASPEPLGKLLTALFDESDCKAIAVVSPDFQSTRTYATDRESPAIAGFYANQSDDSQAVFLLATFPDGNTILATQQADSTVSISRFALPPLPEGFVYTGIGVIMDTIVASWEEQDGYSIGAAGFMVLKRP